MKLYEIDPAKGPFRRTEVVCDPVHFHPESLSLRWVDGEDGCELTYDDLVADDWEYVKEDKLDCDVDYRLTDDETWEQLNTTLCAILDNAKNTATRLDRIEEAVAGIKSDVDLIIRRTAHNKGVFINSDWDKS